MAAPMNPKDSMKSTWRSDKSQWTFDHRLIHRIYPEPYGNKEQKVPVFKKTDPVPILTQWSVDIWVALHAAWPMLLQYIYTAMTGSTLHPIAVFLLYAAAWQINSIHSVIIFQRLGMKFGFLDGDVHARDDVPDVGVAKATQALLLTTTSRPIFTMLLTFHRNEAPLPTVWLPLELALYSIVLDFFFYVYHRSCHEVNFLWKYHRTHHLTKHPNPFLSAYADHEQEILEMALIPMATYGVLKLMGLPMTFYDWWICHEFLIWAEAMGHSGIRLYASAPGLSRHLLNAIGCELLIEDHDLHHRKGYRKSTNYGKQTRLWDKLFGTAGPRYEMAPNNIDWDTRVNFPLI